MKAEETILHLTIKKKWFDMIASGEKKEEYREIKQYWIIRLLTNIEYLVTKEDVGQVGAKFKKFDSVRFTNGYAKNAPTITLEFKGIEIGKAKPEWSDNWQGDVFVIKLGETIKPNQ